MIGLAIAVGLLVMLALISGFLMGYYFGKVSLVPPSHDEEDNDET